MHFAKEMGSTDESFSSTLRAIMISQEVDLVAGDFNGTAWRCRSRNNLSTIDEAFADCALPTPPGPTPLWWPGSIPDNWADVCGFLKPPGSDRFWKVRTHGAFSIPRKTLGLRPTDQSCHHETWLHLDFVDWSNTWSKKGDYDRHISLKERLADCSHGNQKRRISEVMSDHSLSSWTRNHLHVPVSCDITLTSSRSDLMSLAVFDRHATGEAYFGFILSFFPCFIFHPEHHVHHVRRKKICWRIVRSLLANCLEMLVLGTNLKTRHSVVGQQTCTINHKMEEKETIHYSITIWFTNLFLCLKP